MNPRIRITLLLPLLLCAFAPLRETLAAPHPSLPPPVVPDCLGVNIHFTDPKPGEMEMLAAAGFKWVRMDLTWAATERKAGEYDFSAYDRLVAALDQHKIRAVLILDYGNPLYAAPGDKHPFTSRAGTPEFRDAFAKWAVAAVSHFKGRGTLWEMWNEPNGGFWKSADKTADYIALAKATGEALRTAGLTRRDALPRVPDLPTASAATKTAPASDESGTRGSASLQGEAFIGPATSTIDLPFLEACFKAGLLDYWDAVSVHPYRQTAPETVEEEYRSLRLLIRRYAPAGKDIPIISGEWGYSTQYPAFAGKDAAARDEQQAKWLARQFLTNLANDVALSIWYDWHDDGTDPREPEHHFGVVAHEYHPGRDPVFDPKPAYTAMKTLTEQLGGFRFNKRVRLGTWNANPWQDFDLFAKGENDAFVMWRKQGNSSVVVPPVRPGRFEQIDFLGVALQEPRFTEMGTPQFEVADGPRFVRPLHRDKLLQLLAAWERAPLEVIAAGRKEQVLKLAVRNVLNVPVQVTGGKEPIQPGSEIPSGAWVATSQTPRIAVNRLGDHVAQLRQREAALDLSEPFRLVTQPFVAVITNPVMIEVLPLGPDFIPVRFENPSGEAWKGHARYLRFAEPEQGTKASDFKAGPIELAVGERTRVVELPLKPPAGEVGAFIQIWEEEQMNDLMLPLPVPIHLPRAERLQGVLDGDRSNATFAIEPADAPLSPSRTPPILLRYEFSGGWRFVRVLPPEPLKIEPSRRGGPFKFALWLHGDGKGCQARIRFKDSTGQVFQPDGPRIDWKGWRYVTFPMQSTEEKPLAHWGGKNDGVIHYPIEWDSIFLLDNVSRQPVEGEIYLSAPTLIY